MQRGGHGADIISGPANANAESTGHGDGAACTSYNADADRVSDAVSDAISDAISDGARIQWFGGAEHGALLAGSGDYLVSYTAESPYAEVACVFGAYLRATDDSYAEAIVGAAMGQPNLDEQTRLYGVPDGEYYVDVISSCPWTLTIERD